MSGRPVHLLAAAAFAATASLMSISAASANCYSCGPTVSYAPVVTYQAPVVYSQSYAAPVAYAQPYYAGCGCAAQAPMYVVNQGPAYNAPVTLGAEPAYEESDQRAYPYYGAGGMRWHHRRWHHRHHGSDARYGYRHHGYGAYGRQYRPFRGHGHRYGLRTFRPNIGVGRYHRGEMVHRMHGPRFAYGPRPRLDMGHRAQRMHMTRGHGMMHHRMMHQNMGPRGPMHGPGPRSPMKHPGHN